MKKLLLAAASSLPATVRSRTMDFFNKFSSPPSAGSRKASFPSHFFEKPIMYALLLCLLSMGKGASAQTLTPIADAKVLSVNPATNYPATSLEIKADYSEVYLKFDLSSLQPPLHAVKLKMRVNFAEANLGVTTWQAYYVSNDSWAENTITWNNKPDVSGVAVASVQPTSSTPYVVEFDISDLVRNELLNDATKILTIKFVSTVGGNGTLASFNQRENTTASFRPQLVVSSPPVLFSENPVISNGVFGQNTHLPAQIGKKTNAGGKMERFYGKIRQSGVKVMRYGGVGYENNVDASSIAISDLCKKVDSMRAQGMEPVLTAPLRIGAPYSTNSIEQAAGQARKIMREVNARYGNNPVTKWIISNEPDSRYTTSSAPDSIRKFIASFSDSLRAEAAAGGYSVKLYGPELSYLRYVDQLTDKNSPNTYILDKIDVFTYHLYPFADQGVQAGNIPDRNGLIKFLTAGAPRYGGGSSTSMEGELKYLQQRIAASNNPNVKVGITEANVSFAVDGGNTNPTPGTDTSLEGTGPAGFIGGQFWAEIMQMCMKNGVESLNFWSVIEGTANDNYKNDIGYIAVATEKLRPSYHHFSMLANNFSGKYCHGQDLLKSGSTTVDLTHVKVFGSKDTAVNRISVMVMNQSLDTGYDFTLHLGENAAPGQRPLDLYIDAELPSKTYNDNIPPQSSMLLVFDASGNIVSNCLYSLPDAVANRPPNCLAPSVVTPVAVSANADPGTAVATNIQLGQPTVISRSGVQSITNNAPSVFPVGITSVIWTITDNNSNVFTANQTVTVTDTEAPIIEAPENQSFCYSGTNNYQIPASQVSDNTTIADISYIITGATQRSGSGTDASGYFNTGTSTISWTAADTFGNLSTKQMTVVVQEAISVSIPDVYAMNSAVDDKNTLYLGYGPTSLTITASGQGAQGGIYKWNTGATTPSISVYQAGIYTVTVTSGGGCQTTASIEINTIDVTCGNNNEKVKVCHNGYTICVAQSAVQAHLDHGDKLGSCINSSHREFSNRELIGKEAKASKFTVHPNPVRDNFNVSISKLVPKATIGIYNVLGYKIREVRFTSISQMVFIGDLLPGTYIVIIQNGAETLRSTIAKQ